ncbi:hypothetical protein MSPP1_000638 [Malassezia sp. CBS 17886]|nr:hypothetical protein MSPP1_000638 [Malassezia sp. CBS 17886]
MFVYVSRVCVAAVAVVVVLAVAKAVVLQLRWRTWLRDVPGPPRESFLFGNLYIFTRRDVVPVSREWITKYGGVMRFWGTFGVRVRAAPAHPQEPRLMVSDPVALDHILRKRADMYPKVRVAQRVLCGIMGDGLIVAEGGVHRRQKRAIQPGFSLRSVRKLMPTFQRHAQALAVHCAQLARSGEALVDMHPLMGCATLDALGEAAFGVQFNSLACVEASPDGSAYAAHPLTAAFHRTMTIATSGSVARNMFDAATMMFPVLEAVPVGVQSPTFRRAAGVLARLAEDIVREAHAIVYAEGAAGDPDGCEAQEDAGDGAQDGAHNDAQDDAQDDEQCDTQCDTRDGAPTGPAAPPPTHLYSTSKQARPDLLASLLRANINAKRTKANGGVRDRAVLTDAELAAQVSKFIFAGHKTSSTQLTWFLLMMAQNPAVQTRLRAEIRAKRTHLGLHAVPAEDADDMNRALTLEELDELTYLEWCIRESLRLHGVIHTTSRTATERDVLPSSDGRRVVIEKGIIILLPLAAISQDPRLWGDDATRFRPERWAEPMPGARMFPRLGGISFLQGARACIGSDFALREMTAFISTLVNALEWGTDGRRIVASRWIVSRPHDLKRREDGCVLRVRPAPRA